MTVIMQQTMPEGISLEILDDVTQEMGVESDPPSGLVVHTHFEEGGRIRVIDVWDSQEQFESFQDSRLMPAMQKVADQHGVDMSQAAQGLAPNIVTVHGVVKGR